MNELPFVVYVHVTGSAHYNEAARRYVESALKFPAGVPHKNIIVCQGEPASEDMKAVFEKLPNMTFFVSDNTGWDIGAYVRVAGMLNITAPTAPMFCCGSSTTFRKSGWLTRMMEVWSRLGPGVYGTQSSNQARPHLNTTGFMCKPVHLLRYPRLIHTREDRYEFEHGGGAWWYQMEREGETVRFVAWDGEYCWKTWRHPENISCRGDQSNCVTFFRINYDYENSDPGGKNNLAALSDGLTDPHFHHLVFGEK